MLAQALGQATGALQRRLGRAVAAGLDGRARAVDARGRPPRGSFTVNVTDRPVRERVDPETGEVVPVETPAR